MSDAEVKCILGSSLRALAKRRTQGLGSHDQILVGGFNPFEKY